MTPQLQRDDHNLPHDAEGRELGTGRSRIDTLYELGIRGTICPSLPAADGIQLHDWTSHCADVFRYFAVGYRQPLPDYALGSGRGIRGGWFEGVGRRLAAVLRSQAES